MNENAAKIDRWAAKTGWLPGSHLHNGMFLVSRPMPDGMLGAASRDWRLAKIERTPKGTRVISVEGKAYELQRYARNALERALAEKGISPLAAPTKNLKGVRCFPYTALD